MLFADLLSLHLVTFLMFLFLFMSLFFYQQMHAWAEVLPSITEQHISPHGLPMQYCLKNHRLSSNTLRTQTVFWIQQSCVIITFIA